jgi:biotin operon repressor
MSTDRQRDLPNLSLEDYFIHFVTQNQEHMSETTLAKILGISRKSLWQRRIKLKLDKLK